MILERSKDASEIIIVSKDGKCRCLIIHVSTSLLIKPIAIDRKSRTGALKQILQQGAEKLKQGFWVLIFPEGTRVNPGERRKFSKTGALLAEQTGRPVVPVAHNAGEIWPARGFLKNSGVLHLVIGAPIDPNGRTVNEIYQQSTEWIETTRNRISRC